MVNLKLATKLTDIALKQLQTSTTYKQPRMNKIKKSEDLYFNKIRQKLRSKYNIPLPMMSGFVDTLEADLDDPIELEFAHTDPADYLAVKKVNAAWQKEAKSVKPNAKWQLKMRWDKKLAIMSGRGIQKIYAESDPEYKNYLEIVSYKYFHCQPSGGGNLENHLFVGQENIKRTRESLWDNANNGLYYKDTVTKLLEYVNSEQNFTEGYDNLHATMDDPYSRFKGLDLDPESNNYTGQVIFNLCEWGLTYRNKRYYLLFDPYTKLPIRCEELKDIMPTGLWWFTSWATHEDPDIFWSKAYTDDFYPVCAAAIDLFNQELTNRAMQNSRARAFDISMFPDVSKLDEAGWREDALVPVNTQNGLRRIADGLYEFKTPELNGTISTIDWLEAKIGKETGVTDLSQGAGKGSKNVNVQFANLQEAQKRIGHKARSYTECWQEIGIRYVQGLQEHLTEPILIKMIGADGFGWDELTRKDLDFKRELDVNVVSILERDKQNVLGKDQKIKALEMVKDSQNVNSKWRDEQVLRDVGGYDQETIIEAMDTQNYGTRDLMAEADLAIRSLLKGKMPELVYDANITFANKILRFEKAHHVALEKKRAKNEQGQDVPLSMLFFDYVQAHQTIIVENAARLASQIKAQKGQAMPGQDQSGKSPEQAQPAMAAVGAGHQRPVMAGVKNG